MTEKNIKIGINWFKSQNWKPFSFQKKAWTSFLNGHSEALREKLYEYAAGDAFDEEVLALRPLFDMQEKRSLIPKPDEFLVEYFESDEGFHLLMFPFEGRYVHEGMAALIAE